MALARRGEITDAMRFVAEREELAPELVRDEIARGRLIIPANVPPPRRRARADGHRQSRAREDQREHRQLRRHVGDPDEEIEKLELAVKYGADTVMDLSTGGNIDAIRAGDHRRIARPHRHRADLPGGAAGEAARGAHREDLLDMIEHQARQGVDYMTIHAAILIEHLPLVHGRITGIVSRGGSLHAVWMMHHRKQNPLYEHFDEVLRDPSLLRRHHLDWRLAAARLACRRSDRAQFAELDTMGELTKRAWERDVQVMVEGPGHVPMDQIEMNVRRQKQVCHEAPFYTLGPLVIDISPGLRPHLERNRRGADRLARVRHALLRHAQGAPRPSERQGRSRRA